MVSQQSLLKKTAWKERSHEPWHFYCPLCKANRKVPFHPKPTERHFFQIGLTAAFFTLLTWHWFSWKGMVSFLPIWTAFEMIYRSKVRAGLLCPHCGFDPFLYLIDVGRARAEVEAFWRKKTEKVVPTFSEPPESEIPS